MPEKADIEWCKKLIAKNEEYIRLEKKFINEKNPNSSLPADNKYIRKKKKEIKELREKIVRLENLCG